LEDKRIEFTSQYYLKRISRSGNWKEAKSWKDVQGTKYGQPFRFANALIIGIIHA
jgi:hypothetical protein